MISGEEKRTRRGLLLIQAQRKALNEEPESAPAAKVEVVTCCKPRRETPLGDGQRAVVN